MNQCKLEVVKQEMARVNINILGISKLKWAGIGEFNSDDHYIYYCGQEGEGNGTPLQYSCLENPMNSMKRQKDRTLKEELPRSVGATGDQWRNNSRKSTGTAPKQKTPPSCGCDW